MWGYPILPRMASTVPDMVSYEARVSGSLSGDFSHLDSTLVYTRSIAVAQN